jgi:lipopolysaccharide export system ATP-binding protein
MLVAEGLRKSYRNRAVVGDFGLTLDAGEVVGLLGPNGAGKTTCFYMIVAWCPPTPARSCSTAATSPQSRCTPARASGWATCRRNRRCSASCPWPTTSAWCSNCARTSPRQRARARTGIAAGRTADFATSAGQLGASLSGGERRRVEIARALAAKPRLMLLDEPFAGVDPISVGEIQRIVRHLKARGIGVLITDHNVRETLGICDRAYILNEGSVLAQGAPDALLANPDVRRVYLGEAFRL